MSPAAPPHRKVTRVAVGVLVRGDGCVLLADRPVGKPYAGYWEFPGGKIEPGEDVATALGRELHEELGVDIGASVPLVTFEFDYPHAFVELQFRLVHRWRGDPHAREGQRMRFVDLEGDLPQPLLPAAVPALRWLLLPRTVLVVGPQGSPELPAGMAEPGRVGWNRKVPLIVIDADWRATEPVAALSLPRVQPAIPKCLMLASGRGANRVADVDGVVLEADAIAGADSRVSGLRGAWVGSAEQLQLAARAGCDFVLVRSMQLAEQLRAHSASLPAYFPSDRASPELAESEDWPGQGRWIDLRPPAASGG